MKNEQQKEKQYFVLSNAKGHPSHFCYLDETGVFCKRWGTGKFKHQFDNLHDAFLKLGAARLERCPVIVPLPKELREQHQKQFGLPGLTRSEGMIYLLLKNAETSYVPKDMIQEKLDAMLGTSDKSFYALMSRLRKKMPHNESIEYKRFKGYKLISENIVKS